MKKKSFRHRNGSMGRIGGTYPARSLGVYMAPYDGGRYQAYRPDVNNMSSWVRLEPVNGGRTWFMYDPAYSTERIIKQQSEG